MRSIATEAPVFVWLGAMDMRIGFDRLAEFVRDQFGRHSLDGALYVFLSRRRDRVRIFYWDRDGFAIWYKRLEAGTFKVESREGVEELCGVDLAQLLEGMDLSRIKLRKTVESDLYMEG